MEKKEVEVAGMVHAFHDEYGENWFSEISWNLIKNNRNGWIRFSDMTKADPVPTSEIKINDVKLKEKDDEIARLKALLAEKEVEVVEGEISVDEMKAFLEDKGVKVHHKAGDKKIKDLYNENRE